MTQKSFFAVILVSLFVLTGCGGPAGDIVLRGLRIDAFIDIPDYPDAHPLVVGKNIDDITRQLGAPDKVTEVGSSQFIQYTGRACLSRPGCSVTGSCVATLTVDDGKVSNLQYDGNVFGPPAALDHFRPLISRLCNAGVWTKLSDRVMP